MKKIVLALMVALFSSSVWADEWLEFGNDQYYYDSSVDVLYYVGPIPTNVTGTPASGGGVGALPSKLPPIPLKKITPTGIIDEPPELQLNTIWYWNWYWYWFGPLVTPEPEPTPEPPAPKYWSPEPDRNFPDGFAVLPL